MHGTRQQLKLPYTLVTGMYLYKYKLSYQVDCNFIHSYLFLFYFNRSVLELVHENHLASVAIPLIYTMKRGYPPDEGAHLALSKYYIVYIMT